jgi:hypothetical protein
MMPTSKLRPIKKGLGKLKPEAKVKQPKDVKSKEIKDSVYETPYTRHG